MTDWSVYVLRCRDGSLYTGIATDVERRLREHSSGSIGAKYLRGRGPLELMISVAVGDRSLASKVEYRLKRLRREQKLALCASPESLQHFIAEFVHEDTAVS